MDTVELCSEIALNPLEMPFTTVNKQSRSGSVRGFMGGVCLVKKYIYMTFLLTYVVDADRILLVHKEKWCEGLFSFPAFFHRTIFIRKHKGNKKVTR